MRKQYKALFTPDGCVLSMMAACLLLAGLVYAISYISQRIFFAPLSESLGIHTSAEFNQYIDETFVEGMSRAEVYQELEKFGDYEIIPTVWGIDDQTCELVNILTIQYIACYTPDDTLVRWTLDD